MFHSSRNHQGGLFEILFLFLRIGEEDLDLELLRFYSGPNTSNRRYSGLYLLNFCVCNDYRQNDIQFDGA